MQVLRRLARCSGRELRLLTEATLALAAASTAIRLLPFRRAIRLGSIRAKGVGQDVEQCVWAVNAAAAGPKHSTPFVG